MARHVGVIGRYAPAMPECMEADRDGYETVRLASLSAIGQGERALLR